jgi:hypothetical protein
MNLSIPLQEPAARLKIQRRYRRDALIAPMGGKTYEKNVAFSDV